MVGKGSKEFEGIVQGFSKLFACLNRTSNPKEIIRATRCPNTPSIICLGDLALQLLPANPGFRVFEIIGQPFFQ